MEISSIKICRHCQDIDDFVDNRMALKQLNEYHKRGPGKTARVLLNYLTTEEIQGSTLLDIGGGVGILQHEMFKAGISHATHVDASSSYLQVSKEEANRQGYADRITQIFGDFVDLATAVPDADIVTSEKVICCYPDVEKFVTASATHSKRSYGIVYPKNSWWLKLGFALMNIFFWIRRKDFRLYNHSKETIHTILEKLGFELCFQSSTWFDLIEIHQKRRTETIAFREEPLEK